MGRVRIDGPLKASRKFGVHFAVVETLRKESKGVVSPSREKTPGDSEERPTTGS